MKVLIMAAGTGGHIIPALAVAKELQKQGATLRWLGTEHGLEQSLVPPTGIPLDRISMKGIRNKGLIKLLLAPLLLTKATWQTLCIIRQYQPTLVIGFGGFVAAPGGLAAFLSRTPLLIHEQNATAGLTNRFLAHFARRIYQAFPNTFAARYQAITCGNPVREEIWQIEAPIQRLSGRAGPINLLITGGSQGAQSFNEMLPKTLATMAVKPNIRHAAGKGRAEQTRRNYQDQGVSAEVLEFIGDMASSYAWADLVICRAGALTVSELAAAGVASVLIPYPHAVDDHQTKNGQWLEEAGAAILIQQKELSEERLASLLTTLQSERPTLINMATAARALAQQDATLVIAKACLDVNH